MPANGGDPYPVAPPRWTVAAVMARGCWPLPRLPREMEPTAREPAKDLPIGAGDLSGKATVEAAGLLAALGCSHRKRSVSGLWLV